MATLSASETIENRISRRGLVAGIAALGIHGLARNARAAETRPLAERMAAYTAALRYEDLDAATIERVKSHVIDVLGCGIAAFDERAVRICRDIAQSVFTDLARKAKELAGRMAEDASIVGWL